jgi:hypothetical protein
MENAFHGSGRIWLITYKNRIEYNRIEKNRIERKLSVVFYTDCKTSFQEIIQLSRIL